MRVLLDSINPHVFEGTPITDALAGYVGGHWADYEAIKAEFPDREYLSYAVNASELADFLDCEEGDQDPNDVAGIINWLKWAHSKGVWRPGVYASEDVMDSVIIPGLSTKLPRSFYRILGARYDGLPVIPDNWDGKQYQDHGPQGQNYDMCVVRDDFFPHDSSPVRVLGRRVWRTPVHATVTFDTNKGNWSVKGA